MKKFLAAIIGILVLTSCVDEPNKNDVILPDSSGNINNLSVIISNDLWNGEVGEEIRRVLAAPVDGLPQEEPLFSINQMPPEAFSGFVRKNRIFLQVQKGQEAGVKIAENPYAKPQKGIRITGETNQDIINQIEQNSEKIIQELKKTEIKEKQRRISKSLKDDSALEEKLGVSMKFPTAYRYAKQDDDFFWIRKDIKNGSMEILIYEVPMSTIQRTPIPLAISSK